MNENKSWIGFHAHFIKAQAGLQEQQQTLCQVGCISNNLVGIGEDFVNLAQAAAEERAEVTNLTGENMNLTTQVAEYANYTSNK